MQSLLGLSRGLRFFFHHIKKAPNGADNNYGAELFLVEAIASFIIASFSFVALLWNFHSSAGQITEQAEVLHGCLQPHSVS